MQVGIGVAVGSDVPEVARAAEALARDLALPLVRLDDVSCDVLLVLTEDRLELREVGSRVGPVYVDFVAGRLQTRRHGGGLSRDPLVRAVGKSREGPWQVLDATAGLGRDAYLLAWAGCVVTAVERSTVMAALVEDGLRRAMQDADAGPVIVERFRLVRGDARQVLAGMADSPRPDAVYIDPMFPPRAKTAASKKEMQLTRLVAGDDPDTAELLEVARRVARHRVVVKRWLQAPPLAGAPDIQYKGQSVRYDVYLAGMATRTPSE